MNNMENLEELYSQKQLILANYLGLSLDEIENIEEESNYNYSYYGENFEIYNQDELDDRIDGIIDDIIYETQWEINNRVDTSDYNYGYYMSVTVNEDAIRYDIENNFGSHIGNYDDNYDEFEGYYIFKL